MIRESINCLPDVGKNGVPAFTLLYKNMKGDQTTCECDFPWEMKEYIVKLDSITLVGFFVIGQQISVRSIDDIVKVLNG